MEKGNTIYIVKTSGTLADEVKAFINYADARRYAGDLADITAGDTIAELGNPDKVKITIKQEEKVEDNKEPISHIPFEVIVTADTYDEDYCEIKVLKEDIK